MTPCLIAFLESLIQYFKVSEAEVYTKVQGFLKNAEGTRKKVNYELNFSNYSLFKAAPLCDVRKLL